VGGRSRIASGQPATHRPDLQARVAAGAGELGDRRLTPKDVPRLGYTVQVLQEALRLCPPAPAVGRTVL
jgi:cytochrome P450